MASASLAVAVIGRSLVQARGLLTKHAVEQVVHLLSDQAIDPWEIATRRMPLGTAGEELGIDRYLKSDMSRTRTRSLFRQGCMLYDLLPSMPEVRLRRLMLHIAEVMRR